MHKILKKGFNMKKLVLFLILLIFLLGCKEIPEEKTLSELQVEACKMADQAGSCDTRLPEIGIVLKEECCQVLGKCC